MRLPKAITERHIANVTADGYRKHLEFGRLTVITTYSYLKIISNIISCSAKV